MKKSSFIFKIIIYLIILLTFTSSVTAMEFNYISFYTPGREFIIETTYSKDSYELSRIEDNKSVVYGVKELNTGEEVEWWVFDKDIVSSTHSNISPTSQAVYRHTNIKSVGVLSGKLHHEVVLERSSGTYYSQFLYLHYDTHWINGFSYFSPIIFNRAIVPDPNSPSGNNWPTFGVRVSYTCVVQAAIPISLDASFRLTLLENGFTLGGTVSGVVYYTKSVPNTYIIKAMNY